jgi:hypothetical protein
MQRLRRAREVLMIGNRNEVGEVSQFHAAPPIESSYDRSA